MAGLGRCLSMPVLVVAAGFFINYYIVLFLLIRPWLSFTSVLGFLHTLLYTILNGMLLISYGLAVARDPGYIPASYTPDLETSAQNSAAKAKERRFCDKCQQLKPPRAHHCRVCKRCVLRMDHHCLWMNNCVGHKNYKAFLLLVFYSCGTCLYSLALVLAFAILQRGQALSAGGVRVLYTFFMLMACLVTSSWLAWNAHLLLQNKTSIEYKQGKRESWIAEKAGQMYRHPYDLGAYANLISVLGPKLNYWLCPMSVGHIGSGLWSRTLSEHHLLLNGVGEQTP